MHDVTVDEINGRWFARVGDHILAGPFGSHSAAWRWVDRQEGSPNLPQRTRCGRRCEDAPSSTRRFLQAFTGARGVQDPAAGGWIPGDRCQRARSIFSLPVPAGARGKTSMSWISSLRILCFSIRI